MSDVGAHSRLLLQIDAPILGPAMPAAIGMGPEAQ